MNVISPRRIKKYEYKIKHFLSSGILQMYAAPEINERLILEKCKRISIEAKDEPFISSSIHAGWDTYIATHRMQDLLSKRPLELILKYVKDQHELYAMEAVKYDRLDVFKALNYITYDNVRSIIDSNKPALMEYVISQKFDILQNNNELFIRCFKLQNKTILKQMMEAGAHTGILEDWINTCNDWKASQYRDWIETCKEIEKPIRLSENLEKNLHQKTSTSKRKI